MSIRAGHPVWPRPLSADISIQQARPPLLYWPALAVAAAVAVGLVASCLTAAWLLARPAKEAKDPGSTAVAQVANGNAPFEVSPPTEPGHTSAEPAAPTRPTATETTVSPPRPPPLPHLALDSLPGDAVGKKRDATPKETAVADPGLVRIDDALKAEQPTGTYGTEVEFLDSPADASQRALKERKLVFVLHISGNFEDAKFT